MFVGFFSGPKGLKKFDEVEKTGEDHYLVLFKSIRGEKASGSNLDLNCASLNNLGTEQGAKHTHNDFVFRNRDNSTQNMIFAHLFEMDKDLGIYV